MSGHAQPIVVQYRRRIESADDGVGARTSATDLDNSFIYVPILGGDRVLGAIMLENTSASTRSASRTCACSTTVAASMSVALENARLFDETQRLLKETEQRAAELAVINSIQQGMAAELDFQAIVDLVGDKLREVFRTGDIGIRWYDADANLIHYLYQYEHGVRMQVAAQSRPVRAARGPGWCESRQPVIANNRAEADGARASSRSTGTDPSHFAGPVSRSSAAIACSARSSSRTTSARTPSASPTCACSPRWPRAWAWRWRMRACSTRRSACSRKPSSARPSWRSSTASRRAWRRSSTSRPSSTWSATSCARCSGPATSASAGTTRRRTWSTTCTQYEHGERLNPPSATPLAERGSLPG